MLKRIKYLYLIVIISFVNVVHSVEVEELYLVKWPVAEQSKTARWKAALAGLKEVLVRKSGSLDILQHNDVQQAYSKVTSYLQRFEYVSQQSKASSSPYTISLYFEPRLIDALIQDAKMPLWGKNRPVTILWLAIEKNYQRYILNENFLENSTDQNIGLSNKNRDTNSDVSVFDKLQENSVRRGVPIITPLMDLEDQASVTISDIWGRFPSTIIQASQRYSADSILLGRIFKQGEQWLGDFSYLNQTVETSFKVSAELPQQVIAKMMNELAELLCKKYCVIEELGKQNSVVLNLSSIKDFKSLKKAEKYLNGISAIKQANIIKIDGDKVKFAIRLLGNIDSVIQGISFSSKMQIEQPREVLLIDELEKEEKKISNYLGVEVINLQDDENGKTSKSIIAVPDSDESSGAITLYYRWLG